MSDTVLRTDLKRARLWLAMAFVLFAMMLAIAFNSSLMNAIDEVTDDWVMHIVGFAIIPVAFCGPLQQRFRVLTFAIFMAVGIGIEIAQIPLANRNASLSDLLFNVGGLLTGWVFLQSRYGDWCRWAEARLGL